MATIKRKKGNEEEEEKREKKKKKKEEEAKYREGNYVKDNDETNVNQAVNVRVMMERQRSII